MEQHDFIITTLNTLSIPIDSEKIEEWLSLDKEFSVQWITFFLSNKVINEIWEDWYPSQKEAIKDDKLFASLQQSLFEIVHLGYNITRFKEVLPQIINPSITSDQRIALFEEQIDQEDCCLLKLYFSKRNYEQIKFIQSKDNNDTQFQEMLSVMADGLFYETGIFYPPIEIKEDVNLSPMHFRIQLNDLLMPPFTGIPENKLLVNETPERLTLLNIKGEAMLNPANGLESALVDEEYKNILETAGLTTWTNLGYIILYISYIIRTNSMGLVNKSFTLLYLNRLEQAFPLIVKEINKKFDINFLTQILRNFTSEEISIRNGTIIMQHLLNLQSTLKTSIDLSKFIVFSDTTDSHYFSRKALKDLTPLDYYEYSRTRLKKYISHKYTRGRNTLVVYLLDPKLEQLINDGPEDKIEAIFQAIKNERSFENPSSINDTVILTTMAIRRPLFNLIKQVFPRLAVLSYMELSPDLNIQPVSRISLN